MDIRCKRKTPRLSVQTMALLGILTVGCLVRLYGLATMPSGLNQDEASEFYEAFSLLHWGIDRNGVFWPVHFISWGSGQNAAYAWLCLPFFKLLGATMLAGRLPMALIGCLSIVVMYRMAACWFGHKKALLFALVLALAPWHIAKSRWALESNLFPDTVLLGVCLLAIYLQQHKLRWLLCGSAVLAFSAYCYGTSYMFLPLFLLPAVGWMLFSQRITIRHMLAGGGIFLLLALPIMLFVIVNSLGLPAIDTPLFSIPRLYSSRTGTVSLLLEGHLLSTMCGNLCQIGQYLLGFGADSAAAGVPGFLILCPLLLPFTAAGLLVSLRRPVADEMLMHFWALAALLVSLTVDVNINRANILWLPILYYTARGLALLPGRAFYVGAMAVLAAFFSFCFFYFGAAYQAQLGQEFHSGYQQCLAAAEERTDGDIYISGTIQQAYVNCLFWNQISPYTYQQTAVRQNVHQDFETVWEMGRYHFYIYEDAAVRDPNAVYVAAPEEAALFPEDTFARIPYGNFYLIWKA